MSSRCEEKKNAAEQRMPYATRNNFIKIFKWWSSAFNLRSLKKNCSGGRGKYPLHVLKPQRISWKHSFLKGLQYRTGIMYFRLKLGLFNVCVCVCACMIVAIQRPAMKIWVCVWVVNTEQVIKLWPLRVRDSHKPECCRTDAWVTLTAFISLCLLTSLSLSLRFCLSETAQYVKTLWTLCSEAYWNTET